MSIQDAYPYRASLDSSKKVIAISVYTFYMRFYYHRSPHIINYQPLQLSKDLELFKEIVRDDQSLIINLIFETHAR
jgi:hypothetical protein